MDYKTQVINGTTYAFIDKSHWNSEKKRGEHKRKYIGKVIEGKLVFNKKYLLEKQLETQKTSKPGPVPVTSCKRSFYGAVYLLSCILSRTGGGSGDVSIQEMGTHPCAPIWSGYSVPTHQQALWDDYGGCEDGLFQKAGQEAL